MKKSWQELDNKKEDCVILGGSVIQKRSRSAKNKLERHSPERSKRLGLIWEDTEAATLDIEEWRPHKHRLNKMSKDQRQSIIFANCTSVN